VYETAVEEFLGNPIQRDTATSVDSTVMFVWASPQFHQHSSRLGVMRDLVEIDPGVDSEEPYSGTEQPDSRLRAFRAKLVTTFRTYQE
jgi:hypothetical protein